jgi:hypothetical protein
LARDLAAYTRNTNTGLGKRQCIRGARNDTTKNRIEIRTTFFPVHLREDPAMMLPHLTNGDIVTMIAIALIGTLVVALRSQHLTIFGLCVKALLVDIGAVLIVLLALFLPEMVL